jgi:hypothetical protein
MWNTTAKAQRQLAKVAGALTIAFAASVVPGFAAEPSAAGLWQKVEDGKPVVWVLVVDHHDGTFEGAIAKTFPKPGSPPHLTCSKCTDDRKDVLHPRHEAQRPRI